MPSQNKIGSIKEVEGQFGFDVYLYFTWRDDRKTALANTTDQYDYKEKKNDFWYPTPEIMNLAEDITLDVTCYLKKGGPSYVQGLTDGEKGGIWINCISRLRASLNAYLILKAYPWDTQRAFMTVESAESTSDVVTWIPNGAASLVPPGGPNAVSGWKITSTGSTTGVQDYPSLGEKYASLTYWIVVERIPDYYIVRLPPL
jgi:hypothetical protein